MTRNEAKSDQIFQYYNTMTFLVSRSGETTRYTCKVSYPPNWTCFSEEKIWSTIRELPSDRAPGPDGFTARFYKVAWQTIKADIIGAFNALWSLDSRSFNHLNKAIMILLRKTDAAKGFPPNQPYAQLQQTVCEVPSSRRLAPRLKEIIAMNQSAFIKERSIHDNFRSVQLACRWLP